MGVGITQCNLLSKSCWIRTHCPGRPRRRPAQGDRTLFHVGPGAEVGAAVKACLGRKLSSPTHCTYRLRSRISEVRELCACSQETLQRTEALCLDAGIWASSWFFLWLFGTLHLQHLVVLDCVLCSSFFCVDSARHSHVLYAAHFGCPKSRALAQQSGGDQIGAGFELNLWQWLRAFVLDFETTRSFEAAPHGPTDG